MWWEMNVSIAYRLLGTTIRAPTLLIDVLWLNQAENIEMAFEVEHTTSIYSGIARMLDLALGAPPSSIASIWWLPTVRARPAPRRHREVSGGRRGFGKDLSSSHLIGISWRGRDIPQSESRSLNGGNPTMLMRGRTTLSLHT